MTRIGGVFLVSHQPARLVAWFRDALGIELKAQGEGGFTMFESDKGATVLSVQAARKDAPKPPAGTVEKEPYGRQTMMVNLCVDDLDATLARLKKHGDQVAGPVDYAPIGRFAWTRTPDGHDVELWQE